MSLRKWVGVLSTQRQSVYCFGVDFLATIYILHKNKSTEYGTNACKLFAVMGLVTGKCIQIHPGVISCSDGSWTSLHHCLGAACSRPRLFVSWSIASYSSENVIYLYILMYKTAICLMKYCENHYIASQHLTPLILSHCVSCEFRNDLFEIYL